MKLTLDIPVGLLREAEAFAAGHAKSVDALVVDALRRVLPEKPGNGTPEARQGASAAARWLRQWEQLVEEVDRGRQSGRSAREILRQSRR
jgi:hypothetical protein